MAPDSNWWRGRGNKTIGVPPSPPILSESRYLPDCVDRSGKESWRAEKVYLKEILFGGDFFKFKFKPMFKFKTTFVTLTFFVSIAYNYDAKKIFHVGRGQVHGQNRSGFQKKRWGTSDRQTGQDERRRIDGLSGVNWGWKEGRVRGIYMGVLSGLAKEKNARFSGLRMSDLKFSLKTSMPNSLKNVPSSVKQQISNIFLCQTLSGQMPGLSLFVIEKACQLATLTYRRERESGQCIQPIKPAFCFWSYLPFSLPLSMDGWTNSKGLRSKTQGIVCSFFFFFFSSCLHSA